MTKKIVVFSGGYDSTLALADVVSMADPEKDQVIALSFIHHSTGDTKLMREQEARVLILRELRKKYPKIKLKQMEIDIRVPWDLGSGANSKGLSQPIFWVCNTIPLLDEGDVVYLGYIQSDQAMVCMSDIRAMWKHALAIQKYKKVKLELPNAMASKAEVLVALMRRYPELIDFCTSCEEVGTLTGSRRCGRCVPCNHMMEALMGIAATCSEESIKAREMLQTMYGIVVDIHSVDELKNKATENKAVVTGANVPAGEPRKEDNEWEDE